MKKHRKTIIYVLIGAVALSFSIFPVKPSALTTHAAANPLVTEPAQEGDDGESPGAELPATESFQEGNSAESSSTDSTQESDSTESSSAEPSSTDSTQEGTGMEFSSTEPSQEGNSTESSSASGSSQGEDDLEPPVAEPSVSEPTQRDDVETSTSVPSQEGDGVETSDSDPSQEGDGMEPSDSDPSQEGDGVQPPPSDPAQEGDDGESLDSEPVQKDGDEESPGSELPQEGDGVEASDSDPSQDDGTAELPAEPAPGNDDPEPSDIIEIILPASFNIVIWPYGEQGRQIYSDDVIICNQSSFPVDVSIANVSVTVNHSLPAGFRGRADIVKDCTVGLLLRRMDVEPTTFLLSEGNNENGLHFSLSARQEGTDSEELLRTQPVDAVNSSDFAVFSLFGDVSDGSQDAWQNGDLKVVVTFEFHRQS